MFPTVTSAVDGRSPSDREAAAPRPAIFCWSGGKDSALALSELRDRPDFEIVALVTNFTEGYDRVSMHGVRRELLRQQAASLGLPLHEVWLSKGATNTEYEGKIEQAFGSFKPRGVETVVFGDIFLEDLRDYRDRHLTRMGLRGLYPIWKRDSRDLIRKFLADGFRAVLTCVDAEVLPESFAGREIDAAFLDDLPGGVDPCGENGEYHTFVFDGPGFQSRIAFNRGPTHRDGRFVFRDLIAPAEGSGSAPR